MKQTINIHSFREAFKRVCPNNFSYEGLEVLFEHLTELEDGSGEELELDVYAFCQAYEELTFSEVAERFGVPEDDKNIFQLAALSRMWHDSECIGETDHSLIFVRR